MRKYHLVLLHGVAFVALPMTGAFFAGGCSANIHDNVINIPNATINATADTDVDVNNVMPDQTVPITLDVKNVYLIPPDTTPPPEHMEDAGHVNVYLDSTSTPPIVVTAEAHVNVKIPMETKPGKHKLICRVHRHDDKPTSQMTEINIEVKASVTIGGDAGTTSDGGADVGNPPDKTTEVDAGADAAAAG
jgi:hypothetical protein